MFPTLFLVLHQLALIIWYQALNPFPLLVCDLPVLFSRYHCPFSRSRFDLCLSLSLSRFPPVCLSLSLYLSFLLVSSSPRLPPLFQLLSLSLCLSLSPSLSLSLSLPLSVWLAGCLSSSGCLRHLGSIVRNVGGKSPVPQHRPQSLSRNLPSPEVFNPKLKYSYWCSECIGGVAPCTLRHSTTLSPELYGGFLFFNSSPPHPASTSTQIRDDPNSCSPMICPGFVWTCKKLSNFPHRTFQNRYPLNTRPGTPNPKPNQAEHLFPRLGYGAFYQTFLDSARELLVEC